MGKYTKEDFIAKVKELYEKEEALGNPVIEYDYSQVEYIDMRTKITIICPEHGEFRQTPANHLKGQKCPFCAGKKGTTSGFIEKAKKVHGNKYDYSKVNYTNATNKVIIKCNNCGNEFQQTPANHLNGQNCPFCSKNKKKTTDDFVKDAIKVHGDKYGYDNVEYQHSHMKIPILCKKHGIFWQSPNKHLSGCGCPKCRDEQVFKRKQS